LRGMTKPIALHVIVRDLDHELRPQRFPRKIIALAPATHRTGLSLRNSGSFALLWMMGRVRLPLGPLTPGMIGDGVVAIRRQKLDQLLAPDVGEARADADVLQLAGVVVQAEQQGTNGALLAAFVPTESGDDTIAFALVLHLEHGALVGLVGAVRRLRNHAV